MNYKKIFKIIETITIAVLMSVALFVAVSMLPLEHNYKIFVVKSGSMEPTIDIGSIAVVFPSLDYKVGDVITFLDPNGLSSKDTVTHRIYAINSENSNEEIYVTKGDANDAPDGGQIKKEHIIGKYVFSVPLIGYLLGYIKTLAGLVLIIIIPATLIVYEEIRKLKKEASAIIENRKNKTKGPAVSKNTNNKKFEQKAKNVSNKKQVTIDKKEPK